MNKKMYGDEVLPSISSRQHVASESPTQDITNQEDTHAKITPRAPRPTLEQPHHPHPTTSAQKPISTSRKPDKQGVNTRNLSARFLTSGNQSPTHTNIPQYRQCSYHQNQPGHPTYLPRMPLRVSPYLPCTSTPNPAHREEN